VPKPASKLTTVDPIDRWLRAYARRQPGCRALIANHYGIGQITAPTIVAELGDVLRFRNGDAIVRYTGLDVAVYSSDGKSSPGHLARQGPPALRWALFEAAMANAYRSTAPDYDYYQEAKDRIGGKRRVCRWPASSPAGSGSPWPSLATRRSRPWTRPSCPTASTFRSQTRCPLRPRSAG